MTARIKLLGAHGHRRARRPQDGRIKTVSPARAAKSSCASRRMPTAFGEKLVMRIFTPEVLVRDFEELGFTQRGPRALGKDDQASRTASSWSPGPTGSGKTTTLYSTLKLLATDGGQRLHDRGPDRDDRARVQPDAGAAGDRRRLRRAACARCCGRIPTSSWSAKSATATPPRWRSRPRSPATWCCRRCTPTTRRRRSRACSTSACRRT